MRNLAAIVDKRADLPLPVELGDVVAFALDADSGALFVAGAGLGVAAYRAADCELLWFVDLRERLPALPADACVAAFEHVPELESLCLALTSGELLLLGAAPPPAGPGAAAPAAPPLEEVGAVEGGLAGAGWSPDGELLALVTGSGRLLLMNKEWELLSEVPLLQQAHEEGGEQQQRPLAPSGVALSWRGDGRYFATATLDAPGTAATVRVWERETGELHAHGEAAAGLLPVAAWQPNGRHLYVACNQAAAEEQEQGDGQQQQQQGTPAPPLAQAGAALAAQRPAEVEAAQQAAAEGIAHVGAWKRELRRRQAARQAAGGSLDAVPSASVLLFERNGLRHGGFELPPACAGCAIEGLAWSPDSDFLAVVLSEQGDDGLPQQAVQVWHRSNWHWYLKGERRYACCAALHCAWDAAAPLLLHLVAAEGAYQRLQFSRQPSVSRRGTAAVVDGAALLLTPLRHTVVPPPMCAAAAALPAPISCLAIRDFGECEAVAAVLSDGYIALLCCVEEDLWEETLEEQGWGRPGPPKLLPRLLQLDSSALEAAAATGSGGVQAAAWAGERRLLVLAGIASSSSGLLVELDIDEATGTATEAAAADRDVPPLLCAASRPAGGVLLQTQAGALLLYSPGGGLEALPASAGFPEPCPHMAATPAEAAGAGGGAGGSPAAFGLSASGQLYWGARQLAAGVTSFALRHSGPGGAHLLYTTRQHTLHTVPLASLAGGSGLVQPQRGQQGQQEARAPQTNFRAAMLEAMRPAAGGATGADVTVRAVEQHALLVAVPPGGVEAVLQMPRGNLEAVRPRALVLPAVAAALDGGDYAGAWQLAASNRLDLNVLVDYRWPRVLGQAAALVGQLPGDQELADLLSGLDEGSTAAPGGLYAAALPRADGDTAGAPASLAEQRGAAPAAAGTQAAPEGGKVRAVCEAVRAALQARDPARHLRAILTSHAKCGDLEAALAAVKAAKEEALQGRATPGATTAEEGLRHLQLFIPDDTLYACALGMHELELAYMVVAHSQKDPGEYLLELQGFAALADPHLRAHAIDAHLRRWPSALRHLVAAGDAHWEAALALARNHGLLRLLLRLTEGNAERQRQVRAAYGEALEAKSMPEDAGLAFVAAGQLDDAIRAYQAAGQWRMCFALAARAGWGEDARRRMAAALAEELALVGRAGEAATLTLQYLGNVDSAVLLLAHGKEWREALRVAYDHSRPDLVETVIAPQAAQAAAALLEDVNENIERVAKYGARLEQLRERRTALQEALAAADAEAGLPSRQGEAAADLFDDAASVADSLLSGLSVYTEHTHSGLTSAGGSASSLASTVGGRRRKKPPTKSKSKSSRIRAGSPQEEEQLAAHLLGLAPTAATCAEAGQLAELLVLLGHAADAALLQQRLALLVERQAAAAAGVLAHPPPALALELPRPQAAALAAAAGPAGAAAAAAALASLPGAELQQRVAAAAAAVREAHWKWDMLRREEGGGEAAAGTAAAAPPSGG